VSGDVFLSRTESDELDRDLAERCWNLDEIDAGYRKFIAQRSSAQDEALAALQRRVRLTDSYRRFPYSDPDLPRVLLPSSWSGWAAHELFVALHNGLRAQAEAEVERITGLPVVNSHRVRIDDGWVSYSDGASAVRS
jgi:phenylacetic acid degradation operon negative regulatory protein